MKANHTELSARPENLAEGQTPQAREAAPKPKPAKPIKPCEAAGLLGLCKHPGMPKGPGAGGMWWEAAPSQLPRIKSQAWMPRWGTSDLHLCPAGPCLLLCPLMPPGLLGLCHMWACGATVLGLDAPPPPALLPKYRKPPSARWAWHVEQQAQRKGFVLPCLVS